MLDFAFTIGGQNVAGAARPLPVIDPSTGQPFTHSPAATVAQLDQAVDAAAQAFHLAAADRRGQHIGAQLDPVGDHGMGGAAQGLDALDGDG